MEPQRARPVDVGSGETLYKSLFEWALDMQFLVDIGGGILDVNSAAIQEYGYSREELLTMNVRELRAPEARGAAEGQLKEAFDRGVIYETVHRRKDGSTFPVEISSRGLALGDSRLLIASLRDITERKRAENALRKSQFILSKSQEVAHVGNWGWNPETNELTLSDEGFRIFGYSTMVFKPTLDWFFSRVHPDDRQLLADRVVLITEEGWLGSFDYRILLPDSRIRYLNLIVDKRVLDETGSPRWVYGIVQDVTERKRVEEELRDSRTMLQLVMDNIPQAIFWKDTASVFLGCNRVLARDVGLTDPSEIVGKTDYDLPSTREQSESYRRYDRQVMQSGQPLYHLIEEQTRPDGTRAWLDTSKMPLHDASGKVMGILCTYEDITERKRADEALRAAKAQAELYLDLMGHDITNMNHALLGYLELLKSLQEPGAAEPGLIQASIDILRRSSRLIESVQKLTRLQAGQVQLKCVDAGELLALVKAEFEEAPGRQVTINYLPDRGCLVLAGDLLKAALESLVDNAIRHSKEPVIVDLAIGRVVSQGQAYYRITVSDNGPGVPDSLKQKIFLTLRELGEKRERRGFGLYLVRTLADYYQGQVWVEDRVPGDSSKGARFVLLLPVAEEETSC